MQFKLYPTAFPQKQMTKYCVQNAAWKHCQDPAPMGLVGLLISKENCWEWDFGRWAFLSAGEYL